MLTTEEVRHIADLARIALDESEIETYRQNLSAILDSFEHLSKADVSDVADSEYLMGISNILREDRIHPSVEGEQRGVLANMPETKDGFLKVKSVF
jgi:aspartyl-tRNA(Asn)/glutamyl-tRNA(Gln) amidotransferase subunit C